MVFIILFYICLLYNKNSNGKFKIDFKKLSKNKLKT